MITQYRALDAGPLEASPVDLSAHNERLVWIDAVNPDAVELDALSRFMGFEVPNRHDMTEIELSSRLYREGGAYVMIANLPPKSESEILPPRPVAFILRQDLLLTIRHSDFLSFERTASEAVRTDDFRTPGALFGELLDEAVSDRADDLEFSMRRLEDLTLRLFRAAEKDRPAADNPRLENALILIAGMGERVSNIRESIASLQRVLNYARTYVPEPWLHEQIAILDSSKNDLTALSDEADFFMNKLSFNLDATLGMINLEETKIIRVLSVVTLLLAPPTLIAGIYGMNFHIMPELQWDNGYVFALALMVGTAIASLWWLRRKKWI